MSYNRSPAFNKLVSVISLSMVFVLSASFAHAQGQPTAKTKSVIDHWTKERRAKALPRDLVIDHQGRGYLRQPDGSLVPYGHDLVSAQITVKGQKPLAKPPSSGGSGGDTTAPSITIIQPAEGTVIGSSQLFSATITDDSGIKSVSFVITYPDGVTTQTFNPGYAGGDSWEITLQGFTDGDWSWHVVAKDGASKGGNTATSGEVTFTVNTGGGGSGGGGSGGGSDIVANAIWQADGAVQTAAGRIYFEMPNNAKRKGPWSGYVCSGTVATDETAGRSIIVTASHCVYDDANKAFARNVLFIPDQAGTSGSGTDLNCSNDPLGCWAPSFGVVDINWTTRTFPDNIEWDYAYYVVDDSGAHAAGLAQTSDSLDAAAGSLDVSFLPPYHDDGYPSADSDDFTHALGYSYSEDPKFMYCAEDMTTEGAVNWWLPSCELSGGSSGGPWMQPVSSGDGPIISVNSWGYTTSPGMAGPMLAGTSALCLFTEAKGFAFLSVQDADGDAGVAVDCP